MAKQKKSAVGKRVVAAAATKSGKVLKQKKKKKKQNTVKENTRRLAKGPNKHAAARRAAVIADLVAKPTLPKPKYRSYFEFQENTEKKKKPLDIEVTSSRKPPPGFTMVPVGHPELTSMCKEISREGGAMIFIITVGVFRVIWSLR